MHDPFLVEHRFQGSIAITPTKSHYEDLCHVSKQKLRMSKSRPQLPDEATWQAIAFK